MPRQVRLWTMPLPGGGEVVSAAALELWVGEELDGHLAVIQGVCAEADEETRNSGTHLVMDARSVLQALWWRSSVQFERAVDPLSTALLLGPLVAAQALGAFHCGDDGGIELRAFEALGRELVRTQALAAAEMSAMSRGGAEPKLLAEV